MQIYTQIMLQDQFISVTDLRTKTKDALSGLTDQHKFIFMNNKPVAVLISVEEYDKHFVTPQLRQLEDHEITPELRKLAEETINMDESELVDI
jgi:PHD/YefM family antitoxin component YafN of YafNO toxin-antitoxin module